MTRKPDPIAPAQASVMISKQEGAMKDFDGDRRLEDTAGQCLWALSSRAPRRLFHGDSQNVVVGDTDAAMRYPDHETTNGMIAAKG
jgi:hypothetical protein